MRHNLYCVMKLSPFGTLTRVNLERLYVAESTENDRTWENEQAQPERSNSSKCCCGNEKAITTSPKQTRASRQLSWKTFLAVGFVIFCVGFTVWEDTAVIEENSAPQRRSNMSDLGYVVPGPAGAPQAPMAKGISPVTAMGAEMFRHMALKEKGNVVISPLSIFVAVSMATAGTTHGGQAHSELRGMLKHNVVGEEDQVHEWMKAMMLASRGSDPGVQLEVANSLWAEKDVKPDFVNVCKNIFEAEAHPLAGKDPINTWVDGKTKGKIKSILAENPLGPAVLVNAVFFKGEWGSKFDEKDSVAAEFKGLDGASMPAMMMKKDDKKMLFGASKTADIAQLPYGKTGRFGAIVALPKQEGPAGLQDMIEELFQGGTWDDHVAAMKKKHVILKMPRFKAEYGVKSLKSTMQELGVAAAFTPGHFGRMTEDSSVYVEDVFHKAVIEVNEEGTVAAAATAVVMTRSLPPPATRMTVDRPFVFAVYDLETRSLLFVCKVETV